MIGPFEVTARDSAVSAKAGLAGLLSGIVQNEPDAARSDQIFCHFSSTEEKG